MTVKNRDSIHSLFPVLFNKAGRGRGGKNAINGAFLLLLLLLLLFRKKEGGGTKGTATSG